MTGDVVVIDAGGTRMRVGSIHGDVPGAHVDTFESRALDVADPHTVLASAVRAHVDARSLSLGAVVVGIPGMLDERRERISHCNNLPALEGPGLRRALADALGVPVLFEQDIMLQLLGEWRAGVARGHDSVFGVYFGTGIGSAWLQGGDPFRPRAACLQAGHVPVAGEGLPCRCGNTDCVEAYASGHTLRALALEHDVPVGELFSRPPGASLAQALERFVMYQAFLLATVVTLLEPDTIVIGGGIPAMTGYPREALIERARRQLQAPWPAEHQRFAFAALGERAPLHGAAALLAIAPGAPDASDALGSARRRADRSGHLGDAHRPPSPRRRPR